MTTYAAPMQARSTNLPVKSDMPMPSSRPVDQIAVEKMLERCRAGEKAALEALLTRFERPIYHLAYRLAGNYDDAHDVASTATLRICQAIGNCKSAVALPAWINRIVTNVFYDMYRRSHKCPVVSLEALAERPDDASIGFSENRQSSPQSYVDAKERRSIINKAISCLPSYQRQIVTLFYHEDLTYEEIAEIMSIPVGTVKSRLNRARTTLLKNLGDQRSALIN